MFEVGKFRDTSPLKRSATAPKGQISRADTIEPNLNHNSLTIVPPAHNVTPKNIILTKTAPILVAKTGFFIYYLHDLSFRLLDLRYTSPYAFTLFFLGVAR